MHLTNDMPIVLLAHLNVYGSYISYLSYLTNCFADGAHHNLVCISCGEHIMFHKQKIFMTTCTTFPQGIGSYDILCCDNLLQFPKLGTFQHETIKRYIINVKKALRACHCSLHFNCCLDAQRNVHLNQS